MTTTPSTLHCDLDVVNSGCALASASLVQQTVFPILENTEIFQANVTTNYSFIDADESKIVGNYAMVQ